MIEHIPEMIDAGIDSFKIEGRMKTALYVACVARTYRKAIDDFYTSKEEYEKNIENATFGEAIWATGGLEKFFAGLISVGELVIARKVGRARR